MSTQESKTPDQTMMMETEILLRRAVEWIKKDAQDLAKANNVNATIVTIVASSLGLELMKDVGRKLGPAFNVFLVDQMVKILEGSGSNVQAKPTEAKKPRGFNQMAEAFKKAGLKGDADQAK